MNPKCEHCNGTGIEQDDAAIGKSMREARERVGMSGRCAAARMGISAPYLSDLELGRRHWGRKQIEAFRLAIKDPYAGSERKQIQREVFALQYTSNYPGIPDSCQPKRIQLSRKKGYRKPDNAVRITRPGKWGNPYKIGIHGDAATCVQLFEDAMEAELSRSAKMREAIKELHGKDLACFCPLDAPCHGDVLLRLANDQAHPTATESDGGAGGKESNGK